MCGMPESEIELSLPDAQATMQLGAALARCYVGGVRGTTVYVHGELGAGKTTCLRSLLRTLGVEGLIRSPTYTLVEVYEPRDLICVHVDLYRVQGPLEVEELGLRDYFDAGCLLLVEWPERGGAALPPPDLLISLAYQEPGRVARLRGATPNGCRWLEILLCDTSLTPYVSNLT
jgi:tRNA threonylcarbamoyladenosine biosynthesis protein TsaE